jgi:predicted lipid-binding transport protein (Tim44 family)
MLRLNIGLALGGLAAMAVGLLGGWALFVTLPLQASALAAVETASPSIATASSDEPVPAARSPAVRATPNPARAPAPTNAVEVPPRAPPAAAPNAAPTHDELGKPRIHLDGERSALSYEGESGGLYINKDRLSVRTPFGKFDIDW